MMLCECYRYDTKNIEYDVLILVLLDDALRVLAYCGEDDNQPDCLNPCSIG